MLAPKNIPKMSCIYNVIKAASRHSADQAVSIPLGRAKFTLGRRRDPFWLFEYI